MRTDTIFYQLFLNFHFLLFELLGQPIENAKGYRFTSEEVKEKAFRFDGIFMPESRDKIMYLVEVQFQDKPDFYWELLAEINLYLNQYKPVQDWQAVAIFAKRSLEPETLTVYQEELIAMGRVIRIYLDDLTSGSIAIDLIKLIISSEIQAPEIVRQLTERTKVEISDAGLRRSIIEMLETVLVSKFSKLSRQEIEAMFLLSDIKQTRVYQEARQEGKEEGWQEGKEEGWQEGEVRLLLRLLSKRFGKLPDRYIQSINILAISQLEDLGEALLDFSSISDLDRWLEQ